MSGGPFCSRALWNLSGRLHCVLCRSVSGARLWNSRSLAVKHDRHAHEERKRDETRRTGGRIYMDPPLYARSLYRHPHHHGKKSATLTVSNASGLERTLKGNLFFQFSRVPRLWVRRRERDRDILRLKNADVSFFSISEGPESGVSFAPSFPLFPSDQFSSSFSPDPRHRETRGEVKRRSERTEREREVSAGCGKKTAKTKYLVDPASSICLSQRLSHACLSTSR